MLLEQGLGLGDLQTRLQPQRFCVSFGLPGFVADLATKDPELLPPCARKSLVKLEKPDLEETLLDYDRGC